MEVRTHRGYSTPVGSFWAEYFEFPERYDRFALSTVRAAEIVHGLVDFRDARVLDVASGTGKNAVEHARLAKRVIGLEPKPKMRAFANNRIRSLGLTIKEIQQLVDVYLSLPRGAAEAGRHLELLLQDAPDDADLLYKTGLCHDATARLLCACSAAKPCRGARRLRNSRKPTRAISPAWQRKCAPGGASVRS